MLPITRGFGLYLLPMFKKEELDVLTETLSDNAIALQCGCSRSQIQAIRKMLGVKSFREKTQTLTFEKLDKLSDKFTDEQIAEHLGMSASGVRKSRERLGVKAYAIKACEEKAKKDFDILNELTTSMSNIEVAKKLGWTREYVNARCKELGVKSFTAKTGNVKTSSGEIISKLEHDSSIHIAPAARKKGKPQDNVRRNYFNENYFASIDSENKAYFLGWIVSDGNLFRTTTSLSICDKEIVEMFANQLDAPTEMIEYIPNHDGHKDQWRIRLNSIRMKNDLLSLGITPNKSKTIQYPKIPRHLERHLIRGIWDGDGHVGKKYSYVCGSEFCLLGIQDALNSRGFPTATRLWEGVGHYRLRLLKSQPQTLLWIYSDCTFYLPRKYDVAHQFW